jgi:hypothetical protein
MPAKSPMRAPIPAQVLGRDLGTRDELARANAVRERTRAHRTRRSWPCPVCGETDGQCIAYPDPARATHTHVWCIRGGTVGRDDGQQLAGWGFRQDRGGVWYFLLDERSGTTAATRKSPSVRPDAPLADAETIDRVLRATARAFGLNVTHAAALRKRGYDAGDCGPDGRYLFASLPADLVSRTTVAAGLLASFASTADLLGTFGYSQDRRRHAGGLITFLPTTEGGALLEFVTDIEGRIVGFQYAPDVPTCDAKGKLKKRLFPQRMTLAGRYHVARPRTDAGLQAWYSEAIHKANLTATVQQAPTVGLLGAGNVANIPQAARALDPDARRLHVLALDRDQWGARHETAAARRLLDLGYRVALARWDEPHKGPDDALVAGAEITLQAFTDGRPTPPRDQRLTHAHGWQRRDETPQERAALLDAAAQRVAERVRLHIEANDRTRLLVSASPPGMGKSTATAALGKRQGRRRRRGEYDLGWIGERKDMAIGLGMAAHRYTIIEPCKPANCSEHELHNAIAESGRIATPIHQQHAVPCAYTKQFRQPGSAFFTLPHVPTAYPAGHQAIIIDELNLPAWLPEKHFSVARLRATAATFSTQSTANRLLGALQATIAEAYGANSPLHGRALFEALDARCGGQLLAWLAALQHDQSATKERPFTDISVHDPQALEKARAKPPVVLPHVWHGLQAEVLKWQRGGEWNSRLRIGPFRHEEWALHITQPLQFGKREGELLPPRVLLDATADDELLSRLFDCEVEIQREAVPPPPHTRHVAVRTGKRYGKVSMTQGTYAKRSIDRAAAELRYLLRELDPTGEELAAGRVGLITHQGCERVLAEAIGIPYSDPAQPEGAGHTGHFWGIRGSNRLETCTILLIVGTPSLQPEDVKRMARALYADDPAPLDEGCDAHSGDWRYHDTRMQRVAEALSHAELTQCAHRNRPLRYDGRVVVTLCAGVVDFLPITTEITSLPHLSDAGEMRATVGQAQKAARLAAALATLRGRGEPISVRTLAAEARVSLRDASPWWAQRRGSADNVEVLPDLQLELYCKSGNTSQIPPVLSLPPPANASPPPASQSLCPAGEAARGLYSVPSPGIVKTRRLTRADMELRPGEGREAYVARLEALGVTEREALRVWHVPSAATIDAILRRRRAGHTPGRERAV